MELAAETSDSATATTAATRSFETLQRFAQLQATLFLTTMMRATVYLLEAGWSWAGLCSRLDRLALDCVVLVEPDDALDRETSRDELLGVSGERPCGFQVVQQIVDCGGRGNADADRVDRQLVSDESEFLCCVDGPFESVPCTVDVD